MDTQVLEAKSPTAINLARWPRSRANGWQTSARKLSLNAMNICPRFASPAT
jgi:hypothetical protein